MLAHVVLIEFGVHVGGCVIVFVHFPLVHVCPVVVHVPQFSTPLHPFVQLPQLYPSVLHVFGVHVVVLVVVLVPVGCTHL